MGGQEGGQLHSDEREEDVNKGGSTAGIVAPQRWSANDSTVLERAAAHGTEGLQRATPSGARVPGDCPIGHRGQPQEVARQRQEGSAVSQAALPGVTHEGQGRALVKRSDERTCAPCSQVTPPVNAC